MNKAYYKIKEVTTNGDKKYNIIYYSSFNDVIFPEITSFYKEYIHQGHPRLEDFRLEQLIEKNKTEDVGIIGIFYKYSKINISDYINLHYSILPKESHWKETLILEN